ncbi:MAG: hypothetical protein AAF217_03655 [Pseudomonadota bacterium]
MEKKSNTTHAANAMKNHSGDRSDLARDVSNSTDLDIQSGLEVQSKKFDQNFPCPMFRT